MTTDRKPECHPVRGTNGSLVVNGSPLVVVSEWANGCPFVLGENRKKGKWLPKTKLRLIRFYERELIYVQQKY